MGSTALAVAGVLLAAVVQAAAPLAGTIRTADGVSVAGATVVVRQEAQTHTATSDAAGAYSLPAVSLPAVVEVSAPGFATVSRLVDRSPADFTLTPASVRESVIVSSTSAPSSMWRDGETGKTSLSREDLEQQPAVTPDEALRVLSGFSLFRRSSARASNPTTHGVTMRGLSASGASRGLVLFDGIPLNDGFGGWVTWTRVPPQAIAGVDVSRGAEGDVFGSDALGGVVAFQSRSGAPRTLSFAGEGGSYGLGSADLAAGLKRGRWSAFGAAGWFTNDGQIPVEPASQGAVDRPASADWFSGFGRVEAGWGDRRLSVSAWGGSEERGNGTEKQWNEMNGGTLAASFVTMAKDTSIAARVSTGPNDFDQSFSAVSASRATETVTSIQHVDSTLTRALVEVGHGIPKGLLVGRLAVGRVDSDFTVETPTSASTRTLRDDSEAVSLQAGFTPANRVTFGAGVRHEWRAAPEAEDGREGATVGHVSGSFRLRDDVIVRGAFATSHRWPTLNELARDFRAGNTLTLANDALRPERAKAGDVGVTYQQRVWSASVVGFWSVVDDAIANVTISSTPTLITRQRQNTGEAHASGVEVDAEVRPIERLRIRVSGVSMGATFQDSLEPALEGNRLPPVPEATFSFFADALLPWSTTASVLVRSTGDQFDDDRNQFLQAPATQVDFRVAGRIDRGGHFGWHFVVENAADARIEVGRTPIVTLAPGRVIRVGFGWKY